MGIGVLSKITVASSIVDLDVKKLLFKQLAVDSVTALGTNQATGTVLTAGKNLVLAADGAVGVTLPVAKEGMAITVVNTVSGQDLKVYAASPDTINAAATATANVVAAGTDAVFHCDTIGHWYVRQTGVGTGTATSSTTAELNTLNGVTAGTVIASKAIVVDAGIKATGLLNMTYGAGTTSVAPVNYTAGTNLTSAVAGATEYDGKVTYQTNVTSSRQVVDTEQFICLTANYSASDVATAQKVFNSPTNGTLTLAATTSYMFEALYMIANTGTTSHTWGTLFTLGGSVTSIAYLAEAYTGTTSGVTITPMSACQVAVATVVPVTAASTSATEFVSIKLRGIIRANAAGTIIPQIQASAQPGLSGSAGVTVLAGSFFRVWPVGSNTVASVGNWS